jgi:hypothetical protein
MKKYEFYFSILILIILSSMPCYGGFKQDAKVNIFNHIDKLYANRIIDIDQASLYKVYALVKPENLPEDLHHFDFQEKICGTPIVMDIYRNRDIISPDVFMKIQNLLLPDMDDDEIIDSNIYPIRIHCPNNIIENMQAQVPDLMNEILQYAEYNWQKEVIEYGFYPPPPDGGFGGNDNYDIFIRDLSHSYGSGYMVSLQINPDVEWYSMATCCVISVWYDSDQQNIMAHEFNHSCAHVYDPAECGFVMEATATYFASMVAFGTITEHAYPIPTFQSMPYKSIDYFVYSTGYQYGGCLFLDFLSEYYDNGDPVFIRKMWENTRQIGTINEPDYLDVISNMVLEYKGETFNDMYREFALWRYFTNVNDDGNHFKDGSQFSKDTLVKIEKDVTIWDMPLVDFASTNPPSEYGANYIQFSMKNAAGGLFIDFKGNTAKHWSADMIMIPKLETGTECAQGIEMGNSYGFVFVPVVNNYKKMALVISNLSDGDHDPENEDWNPSNYSLNAQLVEQPNTFVITNKMSYFTNDNFTARLVLANPSDQTDADLVIALGIDGGYLFYPAWSSQFQKSRVTLNERSSSSIEIMHIDKTASTMSGVFKFYALLLKPGTGEVIGNINEAEFEINHFIPMTESVDIKEHSIK